jgi:uncharacterized membrane protein
MNNVKFFVSPEYLLSVATGTKFESIYLYFSAFILAAALFVKLFILIRKNRLKAYKNFDAIWFWGFFAEGMTGLFIWFSRAQSLSFFSTRLISYLWIISIFVLVGYLIYYYKKILPQKIEKHYEKKRKEKYLNR